MENPWIQTYTNKKFDLVSPDPDSICIEDIAHALSHQCRYTGHTRKFYSVAEHCINVARLVAPGQELAGLLHDATEAYTGDLNTPLKRMCPDFIKVQDNIERVLCEKFEVDYPYHESVHVADRACLVRENEMLFDFAVDNWTERYRQDVELDRCWILGLPPDQAERYFMLHYNKMIKGTYVTSNSVAGVHSPVKIRALLGKRRSA